MCEGVVGGVAWKGTGGKESQSRKQREKGQPWNCSFALRPRYAHSPRPTCHGPASAATVPACQKKGKKSGNPDSASLESAGLAGRWERSCCHHRGVQVARDRPSAHSRSKPKWKSQSPIFMDKSWQAVPDSDHSGRQLIHDNSPSIQDACSDCDAMRCDSKCFTFDVVAETPGLLPHAARAHTLELLGALFGSTDRDAKSRSVIVEIGRIISRPIKAEFKSGAPSCRPNATC